MIVSFSYRHGLPREADLVFDVRFLRNPHYDEQLRPRSGEDPAVAAYIAADRSEEHTSELQSLMRISYAIFCLIKKINKLHHTRHTDLRHLHLQFNHLIIL